MATQAAPAATPFQLLQMGEGLIVNQSLYAVASLGVADLLRDRPRTTAELARELGAHEPALYRVLRMLASQGVFEETAPRTFGNSELSRFLCTGAPGSVRSMILFRGSEFFYRCFGEILHSVKTGEPAREKLFGKAWEYLREHPELARTFDDAMTELSVLVGPAIAASYDFGAHGSLMDVGGGNGIFLAAILKAHPKLRGVLADQPHVIERARQRDYLGGELGERSAMQPCDFLREVPSGCRAYVMKNVIVDWNDQQARAILSNCRRAIPPDGVLLLVEPVVPEGNLPSVSKILDMTMLVLTGGIVRTALEHRELLASAGFRLQQIISAAPDLSLIEAFPA